MFLDLNFRFSAFEESLNIQFHQQLHTGSPRDFLEHRHTETLAKHSSLRAKLKINLGGSFRFNLWIYHSKKFCLAFETILNLMIMFIKII